MNRIENVTSIKWTKSQVSTYAMCRCRWPGHCHFPFHCLISLFLSLRNYHWSHHMRFSNQNKYTQTIITHKLAVADRMTFYWFANNNKNRLSKIGQLLYCLRWKCRTFYNGVVIQNNSTTIYIVQHNALSMLKEFPSHPYVNDDFYTQTRKTNKLHSSLSQLLLFIRYILFA